MVMVEENYCDKILREVKEYQAKREQEAEEQAAASEEQNQMVSELLEQADDASQRLDKVKSGITTAIRVSAAQVGMIVRSIPKEQFQRMLGSESFVMKAAV